MSKQKQPIAKLFLLSLVLASGLVFAFPSSSTHAATFTVVDGNDTVNDDNQCQLTEAIDNINAQAQSHDDCPAGDGNDDTIELPAGTVTLTADLPTLNEPVSIEGQGVNESLVDGDNNQYIGFLAQSLLSSFEASNFTGQNADGAILNICARTINISNVVIENSEVGAGLNCGSNVSVTDSEFNNNIAQLNEGQSGLTIGTSTDNCSLDTNVELLRVKANGNGATGLGLGGAVVYSGEECNGSVDQDITLTDVETNNNTASGIAGTYAVSFGEITVNRFTSSNNQIVGNTEIEGAGATSGVAINGTTAITLNNITVSDNIAMPDPGSNSAFAGLTSFSFGSEPDTLLINSTVVSNIIENSNNADVSGVGVGIVNSVDFVNFAPGRVSNLLATGNMLDDTAETCMSEISFDGENPSSVPYESGGGNVVGDDSCSFAFTENSDQNKVSGLANDLGSLSNNGGFVSTIELFEGSKAIDSGVTVAGLSTDARSEIRPQGGAFDSGAYESPFTAPEDDSVNSDSENERETLAETGQSDSSIISLAFIMIIVSIVLTFKHNALKLNR